MVSFAKMGVFEKATKLPTIDPKEVALLLCALNPFMKIKDIPENKLSDYSAYKTYITRCFTAYNKGRYNQDYNADIMFTIAYPLIDEDITPSVVKERALTAISYMTRTQKWKETLYALGGNELVSIGISLSQSKRGQYKKDEEQVNIYKMAGMLLKLLAKKQGGSYGSVDKPNIAKILTEIETLANECNLRLDGLSKSSFYEKAKVALLQTLD